MKDTSSCPNEGCRSSKECDKLRSATKQPKGIVSFANALKGFKWILLAMLQWFGASTCRQSRSETLLPCSSGRADVRITNRLDIFMKLKKRSRKLAICLYVDSSFQKNYIANFDIPKSSKLKRNKLLLLYSSNIIWIAAFAIYIPKMPGT